MLHLVHVCLSWVYVHKEYFVLGINCGRVPEITGMDRTLINDAETFYDDSFTFACLTSFTQFGMSSDGTTTVQCMNNTHWDLGDLRCEGRITV